MSAASTATINWPLTTYAQGLMQDRLAAYRLAGLLVPIVQVTAAAGTFKKFDDRNDFLVTDTLRGLGGHAKRMNIEATNDTYLCQPHALEIAKDDWEMDLVGSGAGALSSELIDQGKIRSLLARKATGYAKRAVDFAFGALTPVADRGNFSSNDIDPIDQLDEQLAALATDVATTENIKVIMSVDVWRKIRANAKVKARAGGVKTSVKREDLTDMLLYPVELEISGVVATATKRGQTTVTKSQIVGNYVILLHTTPSATINDPSAFKCFSTSSALVDAVRTYREESASSDVHKIDWSEDMKQTSALAARLLAIT